MKILFVNPYIYDFTAYDLWLRPLGLLYIASVVKKYSDCEVFWLDALDRYRAGAAIKPGDTGRGKYAREIVEKPPIYANTPRKYARYGIPAGDFRRQVEGLPEDIDMICITTMMTYWIDGLDFTLGVLADRFPRAKVVMGGIIPTLLPPELLSFRIRETVKDRIIFIKGRGEEKILKLIEETGGKVSPYPDFSNIDNLPYPAFELLTNRKTLPLLTSRGCPFDCTYCASNLLSDRFIERRAENIRAEIDYMQDTFGTEHFVIFDDALLVNRRRRFFKVFSEMQGRGLRFHTPNGLHTGEIDGETAEILFAAGFKTIRLSFESTGASILSKSSFKVTVKQMEQAVENLERAGYKRNEIGVYLLFGFPGQDLADIEEALFFVKDLGVAPHLAYFSPVPGTREFADLQAAGILSTPTDLYETNKIYFIFNKSGFSRLEIKRIKDLSVAIARGRG
ncbi:MAG: radical SAM protein [Candidatus Aminicenantes bacterium]|nr:radical SAM protein [Candidatus Aminicenantes bacterium]